ncbi:MAG: dienelactone hydrolase family protein, partial [Gemmatimonadaceae bacterium]|nr:dienelactone hydrolase family protein [Gemmatimonadaceae bacterium]
MLNRGSGPVVALAALPLLLASGLLAQSPAGRPIADEHAEHAAHAALATSGAPAGRAPTAPRGTAAARPARTTAARFATGSAKRQTTPIPAGSASAKDSVEKSHRHHEYVKIATGTVPGDSVAAWVVYPQVRGKAPVVVVIHEIFGLTMWIRAVADQLAADGFIAIAPDLMTGKISPATPDSAPQLATQVIRTLNPATVQAQLKAVGEYGLSLPAARKGKYGVVGFCWGGSTSFAHAVANPDLGAAVVYYGSSPASAELAKVKAPVLGL